MLLDPQSKFRCDEIENWIQTDQTFELSPQTRSHITQSRKLVEELSAGNEAIYGVNTGFGRLAQVRISKENLGDLQVNLLRSHASGIGEPMSEKGVRRLILLRLLSLAKGYSGISLPIIDRHLDYLHRHRTPFVPLQGSVGASGDLAPLSHLGLSFMGEGAFLENGVKRPAKDVLAEENWKPLSIGPKEGLSLTNGTQFSLSLAMEVLFQLKKLLPWMEAAAAMSVEAFRATDAVYDPRIHSLKAHPHQQKVAARLASLLKDSPHMKFHEDCELVQDPYSFRCIPQILGPCYSLIDQAESLLEGELNSVSDNPLVFLETKELLSCGHFHAHSVSLASDVLATAMISMGNLIERRMDQLVNPLNQRLPGFLTSNPGLESGMMIVHTAVASITSENKTLGFPASADTIPTNGNQEDHVSMAPNAARKALQILGNLRKILAAEFLCGVRACVIESTRTGQKMSPALEKLLEFFSTHHPNLFLSGDRLFSDDWYDLEERLKEPYPFS